MITLTASSVPIWYLSGQADQTWPQAHLSASRGGTVTQASGKSVLCIGSDLVNLNLRCALLKEKGWEVASSGSGHEGIFRFAQGDVAAVVLDLNDDGAESALIAAEVKRQSPEVRVVMLVRDIRTLIAGATAQADAVVLKSEEEKILPDRIRELLRS